MAAVFLLPYLVHSTYVFLCTRATKDGKNVTQLYVSHVIVFFF